MEMHQIRYFLAVARTLNFTRAAEECNVSQPSLTRAVQKLEDELGGEMLRRERSLTHLTELGHLMHPHLERTFEASQAAKELAKGIGKAQVARLNVGISSSIECDELLHIIKEISTTIPGLELSLFEESSSDLINAALKGTIDLLLVEAPEEAPERLDPWPLFTQSYHMLARADQHLSGPREVALTKAAAQLWIDDFGDGVARLRAAAAQAGLDLQFRHSVRGAHGARKLVLAGMGCAVVGNASTGDERLIAMAFVDPPLNAPVVLAAIAGRQKSLASDAFVRAARARGWHDR